MQKRFLVLLASALMLSTSLGTAERSTAAHDAIVEAITILETRKAQTDDKHEQDRIAVAIAALQKLNGAVGAAGKDVKHIELTATTLKKKLHTRAVYNQKTGELTLSYDFQNKRQLDDFDLGSAKPVLRNGGVLMPAGESMRHLVHFKTLRVNGQLAASNFAGEHLRTTEGFGLNFPNFYGAWRLGLVVDGKTVAQSENQPFVNKFTPFELAIEPERAAVKFLGVAVGKPLSAPVPDAGQLELCGGFGGDLFAAVVISGKVDEEWAQTFFAP
jgi:hypothetical protein